MKRSISTLATMTVAGLVMAGVPALSASAAVKPGQSCKKLGDVKDGLTCVAKGKKRVYGAAATVTAAPTTVAGATPAASAAPATGLTNVPGFDGKTITIGYLGNVSVNTQFPASASFADGGKALTAGYNAYISRVNEAGGIAGKYRVKVDFKETYYTPSEATKAYAEQKNSVVMIGQIYGTPQTQALEKSLQDDGLVGSPISLDAAWVNSPNYLPVGGTYQQEAINLVDWYTKEGGGAGKTVCSLALANNAYGNAGENGFDIVSKAGLNFKVGIKIKTSTAAAQAQQLKDGKCDAVVITISGEAQTPPLLSETAKIDYFPTFLALGPSFATRSVVPANSAQFAKQVIVATDGSQWGDEKVPGMKALITDLKKYAPEYIGNPNPAATWGYTQAQDVVALLEKAVANGDLSHAGIKKALYTLGKTNHGGLYPDWTYTDAAARVAPSYVNLSKVDISVPGGLDVFKQAYDAPASKAFKPGT